MMSVLFQREPDGFWQVAPRERPLWALVVALATLALFVAALCVLAVGARAGEATYRCVDQTPCYYPSLDAFIAAAGKTITTICRANDGHPLSGEYPAMHDSVDSLCHNLVGERAEDGANRIKHDSPLTAGQLTTNEPIAVPCTGCILVDGKWVPTAPPGFHRTRCLPVGSDQIVDCWVEDKP